MTLHFADVSNWQQGMSLAGMPAVIAKATEGTGYRDPYYAGYQAQAASMGVPFVGYHYLHHGSIEAQAQLAFTVVGAAVPLMLDVEVVQGEADPTLQDVTQFVAAYRARGGRATLIYLPKWFWSGHWGSPDLRPLAGLGLALISSDYSMPYSDTGPGWAAYGGVAPAIWQYTSSATVNGRPSVDMNAYRGSATELRALFAGSSTVGEDDMPGVIETTDSNGDIIFMNKFTHQWWRVPKPPADQKGTYWPLQNELDGLKACGVPVVPGPSIGWKGGYNLADDSPDLVWAGQEVRPPNAVTFTPDQLAAIEAAAEKGAEAGAPSHDELVAAAFEGAQRAEGE